MSHVEALNKEFGIPNSVSVVAGKGDMPRVELSLGGSSVAVYLVGCTGTSFKDDTGAELIWLSETSNFAQNKAIRGGIPICWPQFGPGPLQQHGFARNSDFKLVKTNATGNSATAHFELTDTDETRKVWPFGFRFEIIVELFRRPTQHAALKMTMNVTNLSPTNMTFTGALHTYFVVPHVSHVAIAPLQNHHYFDKVDQSSKVQQDALVTINGETDRIYHKMPALIEISNSVQSSHSEILIEREGFTDAVIWNPGPEKQKTYSDLSGWEDFVCVESAVIEEPATVHPNSTWTGSHIISRRIQSAL